jgi:hypothetical protein
LAAKRWTPEQRERLGAQLTERREELDPRYYTREVFAAERGINLRMAADLEKGRSRNFTPLNIRDIVAPAYAVTEASIYAATDAGDLVAVPGSPPRQPAAAPLAPVPPSLERAEDDIFPDEDPEMRALTDAHVPAIRKLVQSAAIDGPLTGSRIFPASPHEAERWDRLAGIGQDLNPGKGYSPWVLIRLMAVGRVRDDQRRAANGQEARAGNVLAAT